MSEIAYLLNVSIENLLFYVKFSFKIVYLL